MLDAPGLRQLNRPVPGQPPACRDETEEARVKTCIQQGGDERGVKPACDRDLPRRSVEVLRDLGLSKEKIVAYHRRFSDTDAHGLRVLTAAVNMRRRSQETA
jgi:hypothetical protein